MVGRSLLVLVDHFLISDVVPTEAEIINAVHHLRCGRAPGPSGVTTDFLHTLLVEDNKYSDAWPLLVKLVQLSWCGYEIPMAYSNAILVLLPKNELGMF
jgi:hypothetical protein